jgi:hypothetical protein
MFSGTVLRPTLEPGDSGFVRFLLKLRFGIDSGKEKQALNCPLPNRGLRQPIGFGIVFTGNVRDGKIQASRQLAAGPVQGLEARAAAGIFSQHLPHYHLRIRINVQRLRFQLDRPLQRFHQRSVFRHVVILVSNPLRDADRPALAAINHYSNARRPRISQGPTVHMRHQF